MSFKGGDINRAKTSLHRLLSYCQSELEPMLDCLRQAVEIESPTQSKPDVDRMARFFAREFRKHRAKVRLLAHATAGDAVIAEFFSRKARHRQKPVMLLGHLDTVWD